MHLTNGSGSEFVLDHQDANKKLFFQQLFCLLLFEGTFTSFFKDKKSQHSRNQGFSYYFCLMIEGSGSATLLFRKTVFGNPPPPPPSKFLEVCLNYNEEARHVPHGFQYSCRIILHNLTVSQKMLIFLKYSYYPIRKEVILYAIYNFFLKAQYVMYRRTYESLKGNKKYPQSQNA
jgi:hypothetical protein